MAAAAATNGAQPAREAMIQEDASLREEIATLREEVAALRAAHAAAHPPTERCAKTEFFARYAGGAAVPAVYVYCECSRCGDIKGPDGTMMDGGAHRPPASAAAAPPLGVPRPWPRSEPSASWRSTA
jgi:hypothetical protein